MTSDRTYSPDSKTIYFNHVTNVDLELCWKNCPKNQDIIISYCDDTNTILGVVSFWEWCHFGEDFQCP